MNIESLNRVLRENTQLYADEEMRETLARVFSQLRTIEDREVYFERCLSGYLEPFQQSNEAFHRNERRNLRKEVNRLERRLEELAEEANLNVKLLEE
jgi:polyhydroxyalkanoate synthesis regulator phasin